MANATNYKAHSFFGSEDVKVLTAVYNFDEDGGSQGFLDLGLIGATDENYVIVGGFSVVAQGCTSAGAATVALGTATDADAFLAATAVGSLTAGATFPLDAASDVLLVGDTEIRITIATADLTAGFVAIKLMLLKI